MPNGDKRFVDVLRSDKTNAPYVGITSDVMRRLATHNSGGSIYAAPHRPWTLLVALEFPTEAGGLRSPSFARLQGTRSIPILACDSPKRSSSFNPALKCSGRHRPELPRLARVSLCATSCLARLQRRRHESSEECSRQVSENVLIVSARPSLSMAPQFGLFCRMRFRALLRSPPL